MQDYCVYLTTYSGNALPPFYIGSSSVYRINKGYRGSVSSKEYLTTWKRQLKTHPELFKTFIIKTFTSRVEATVYENKLQHKLKVVSNPLYINKWYAITNGFHGYSSKGHNNPNYGKKATIDTRLKISIKLKGRKLSILQKEAMSKRCLLRRKDNSWGQLRVKPLFSRFRNYKHFGLEIMSHYEACSRIPLLISEKMSVTESSVKTYLKHHNLLYSNNPNWTKVVRRYGNRWNSFEDYEASITNLCREGLSPYQIAGILNINAWGVESTLKRKKLTSIRAKTGPKSKKL